MVLSSSGQLSCHPGLHYTDIAVPALQGYAHLLTAKHPTNAAKNAVYPDGRFMRCAFWKFRSTGGLIDAKVDPIKGEIARLQAVATIQNQREGARAEYLNTLAGARPSDGHFANGASGHFAEEIGTVRAAIENGAGPGPDRPGLLCRALGPCLGVGLDVVLPG